MHWLYLLSGPRETMTVEQKGTEMSDWVERCEPMPEAEAAIMREHVSRIVGQDVRKLAQRGHDRGLTALGPNISLDSAIAAHKGWLYRQSLERKKLSGEQPLVAASSGGEREGQRPA